MFYTVGDATSTRQEVIELDLTNLNSIVKGASEKLSQKGLTNLNGGGDFMNNADFVYNPVSKVFYVSSDCHPWPSAVNPSDVVVSAFRVTGFKATDGFTSFTWKNFGNIGAAQTGFARNHNTGIVRDAYGHLLTENYLTVYYTSATAGDLWSYRMHAYHVDLH